MSDEGGEIQEASSVRSIHSGFNDLFDSFRREFDDMLNFWWPVGSLTRPATRPALRVGYPISDLEDKGTHYELRADLPGVPKENADIKVTEGGIEISGKLEESKEESSGSYILRERRMGSFTRSFSFPEKVLPKKAEAELKDGMLYVKVPKKEPKKEEVHMIKIK
ncbi:MAG: Hsp20/alpha crystallin family protein [Deltaproteobacteria bacterium]|nr:Hsp20/alpha crystallin family protein [Deltaproteobacteria bacterium]